MPGARCEYPTAVVWSTPGTAIWFIYCVCYLVFLVLISSWGSLPLQSYWSLSCDRGLHCSYELIWEHQEDVRFPCSEWVSSCWPCCHYPGAQERYGPTVVVPPLSQGRCNQVQADFLVPGERGSTICSVARSCVRGFVSPDARPSGGHGGVLMMMLMFSHHWYQVYQWLIFLKPCPWSLR